MNTRPANRLRQIVLPGLLVIGDILSSFFGLTTGYWLRYESPLKQFGIPVEYATFDLYSPLLGIGVLLLMGTFAYLNVYDQRLLLRKLKSLGLIVQGVTFWLFAYLGVSLALKFDPPISRLFVLFAYMATLLFIYLWRTTFYWIISKGKIAKDLRLRVAVLGYNAKAEKLIEEIGPSSMHPFGLVGYIEVEGDEGHPMPDAWSTMRLGEMEDLDRLLREQRIDVLLAANIDMTQQRLVEVTEVCERSYVEWKVIPSVFDVFVSNLRLQMYGTVPVLGVEDFAILRLLNRVLKRGIDILIAAVGLVVSAPIVAILGLLIKKESSGAILFRQERIGSNHKPFTMLKLRSMKITSTEADKAAQSTLSSDPRLLNIGRLMRNWNLDELPQFWNVLKGEMSIVGPRPERPYHVEKLSESIPHYMPRHLVKPGMTGWAQANRLRGEGTLEKRIQHDIYYIENWSLWFDFQIVMLTFLRWKDRS